MKKTLLVVLIIAFLVTACATQAVATPGNTSVPHTSTATKTFNFTPTPTFTPIPTATPIPHPMSLIAMRNGDYPGSEITIVKELTKGLNYRRYYAYYLSDGLKIYALLTIPESDAPEGGFPAIVFNHGYIPPDVYRTTERYIAYVDEIAKAGYVVFRIDYRGHDASEGEATRLSKNPNPKKFILKVSSYNNTMLRDAFFAFRDFFDSFNGLRYPRVGGRGQCLRCRKNPKPEKCL